MLRTMTISCGLMVATAIVFAPHPIAADVDLSQRRDGRSERAVVLTSTDAPPEPENIESESAATDLSPELQALRGKMRECLRLYYRQPGNVAQLTPWELMHASLAFGVDTQAFASRSKVNALGWLCWNGRANGRRLLAAPGGSLRVQDGFGVQGHDGQFLSILAQCKVRVDSPIKVGGYDFTVADLVAYEKATCRAGSELTFKLIGLVHYLDSEETWQSDRGETWSIPRLIKEEIEQPVVGAACGGTHRMMGFSYAVRKRDQRGEPFIGEWKRAKKYVEDYHEHTFKLQNSDGSFSTNWFAGRGDWGSASQRLNTSGHTLEWLVCSLPREQLHDPRVMRSVTYLTDLLQENHGYNLEMGALGHALHALILYDERVFGSVPGNRAETLHTDIELAEVSG